MILDQWTHKWFSIWQSMLHVSYQSVGHLGGIFNQLFVFFEKKIEIFMQPWRSLKKGGGTILDSEIEEKKNDAY